MSVRPLRRARASRAGTPLARNNKGVLPTVSVEDFIKEKQKRAIFNWVCSFHVELDEIVRGTSTSFKKAEDIVFNYFGEVLTGSGGFEDPTRSYFVVAYANNFWDPMRKAAIFVMKEDIPEALKDPDFSVFYRDLLRRFPGLASNNPKLRIARRNPIPEHELTTRLLEELDFLFSIHFDRNGRPLSPSEKAGFVLISDEARVYMDALVEKGIEGLPRLPLVRQSLLFRRWVVIQAIEQAYRRRMTTPAKRTLNAAARWVRVPSDENRNALRKIYNSASRVGGIHSSDLIGTSLAFAAALLAEVDSDSVFYPMAWEFENIHHIHLRTLAALDMAGLLPETVSFPDPFGGEAKYAFDNPIGRPKKEPTPEQAELLDTLSDFSIAKIAEVSIPTVERWRLEREAVKFIVTEEGHRQRAGTLQDESAIRRMFAKNKSDLEIAKELHVSMLYVKLLRDKLNIKRANENPSKAFQTLVDAKAKYGGWSDKSGNEKCIVILGGPYCGTYSWTTMHLVYSANFRQLHEHFPGKAASLDKWQRETILKLLLPTTKVVHEALLETSPKYRNDVLKDRNEYETVLAIPESEFKEWYRKKIISEGNLGNFIVMTGFIKKDKYLIILKNAKPLENTLSDASQIASKLYILSQVSGISISQVNRDIAEHPKRILSIHRLHLPPRAVDRQRFSKELLTSWSVQKAYKKCLPGIEGTIHNHLESYIDLDDARYGLNKVPSWKNIATTWGDRVIPGSDASAELIAAARQAQGTESILGSAAGFRLLKVPASDFRKLLVELTKDQLSNLMDVITRIPAVREPLAETVEGRRVLEAHVHRDYKAILRAHDFVMAIPYDGASITEAEALEWHQNALQFTCPPGVRPLLTKQDFITEGEEMKHCVAGYFWQRKSLCFAFQHRSGGRATLELRKTRYARSEGAGSAAGIADLYSVAQFQGVGNGGVGFGCPEMLATFTKMNKKFIR